MAQHAVQDGSNFNVTRLTLWEKKPYRVTISCGIYCLQFEKLLFCFLMSARKKAGYRESRRYNSFGRYFLINDNVVI